MDGYFRSPVDVDDCQVRCANTPGGSRTWVLLFEDVCHGHAKIPPRGNQHSYQTSANWYIGWASLINTMHSSTHSLPYTRSKEFSSKATLPHPLFHITLFHSTLFQNILFLSSIKYICSLSFLFRQTNYVLTKAWRITSLRKQHEPS